MDCMKIINTLIIHYNTYCYTFINYNAFNHMTSNQFHIKQEICKYYNAFYLSLQLLMKIYNTL